MLRTKSPVSNPGYRRRLLRRPGRWWWNAPLWVKGLVVLGPPMAALLTVGIAGLALSSQNGSEDAIRNIDIAGLVLGIAAGVLSMRLFLGGIARRMTAVSRNTERFLAGEKMERVWAATDEIGSLQAVLLEAASLLTQRERELQGARDEALAATRAKDNYLSRMSHELRTPLTAVLGFGQLLQMEDLNEDDADSVNHIVSAGKHLLALVNDVLDIARIETGDLSLSVEPIVLSELVAESVALMRPLAAGRRIVVEDRQVETVVVLADRQRLKQVLLNLLSNAIKYNRDGGSVVVTSGHQGDATVVLNVTDSGVGIAQASLGRLFEPFERLGAEGSGVEGAGVGLSLSKALAEAMHGTIEARSEQGVGSTFSVILPAGQLVTVPAIIAAGNASRPGGRPDQYGLGGIVLYVEDNMASARVIQRVFSRRQEDLQVAIQGKMVLDLARDLQPRLILLDLHLPDMSGEEVLQQLKGEAATAGIPVVILSADATAGRLERLIEQGAAGCLTKPVDVTKLMEILDQLSVAG